MDLLTLPSYHLVYLDVKYDRKTVITICLGIIITLIILLALYLTLTRPSDNIHNITSIKQVDTNDNNLLFVLVLILCASAITCCIIACLCYEFVISCCKKLIEEYSKEREKIIESKLANVV